MAFVIDKVRGRLGPSKASKDDNDCLDSKAAAREAKENTKAQLEKLGAELKKARESKYPDAKFIASLEKKYAAMELVAKIQESR
ncbi:MAG: hypothetical protein R8N24_02855 [Alphaproteobacteria bacterium]|nr:hypothetical protein [Alphaproteobacteria bacterium]